MNLSLSLSRIAHDRADHRHVFVFDAAAQGERHQLLGDRAHELRRVLAAAPAATRPDHSPSCHPTASTDASIGTPPSPPCLVRHDPSASKFSSANPIGSISLWQLAHGSVLAMQRHLLAQRHDLVVALAVFERRNVRRRLRRRSAQDVFEHPHAALHRRRPEILHPGERQHAALPQQSSAIVQVRPQSSRGGTASRKYSGCRSACASRSFRNV